MVGNTHREMRNAIISGQARRCFVSSVIGFIYMPSLVILAVARLWPVACLFELGISSLRPDLTELISTDGPAMG